MTIEGLGKKFQAARQARNLSLDEAARLTKIRPARLAEIEADDFSQFPSLAYAKGFLLIYGKFLNVDVTPYLEAFESADSVTVDGYSYLQEKPSAKPIRARVRAPVATRPKDHTSLAPFVVGVILLLIGFSFMKLILNLQRIAPRTETKGQAAQTTPSPSPVASGTIVARHAEPVEATPPKVAAVAPTPSATPAASAPEIVTTPAPLAASSSPPGKQPEVRRAQPVRAEDLAKAAVTEDSSSTARSSELNRVDIRPLKKTYIKVIVDNEAGKPAFERWISPSDGTVEFRGQHIAVRVLDRDAVQIKKNGKLLAEDDTDVTIE
jgi:cytoskeletal protein RodZ